MDNGRQVTQEEAQRLNLRRRAATRRRRIARWSAMALLAVAVSGWIGYTTLGFANRLNPPESDISADSAVGDWPMFQRNPAHSGFVSDDVAVPEGTVVWQFETAAPIVSSPAVVQGALYLSTGDRRIVALNAGDGTLIWEREVTGPVDSSPAVAGDLVFVGLKDGGVIALAKSDGALQWEFQTGDLIYSSPAVHRGVVYIGSTDDRLYALDAATGHERWSYETEGRVMSAPALYEDVVSVTSQDRRIYILDAVTGKHRLDIPTSDARGAPALDDEMAYVADTGGLTTAIDWSKSELPFEKTARWVRTQLFWWQLVDTLPPPKGFVWRFRAPRESFIGTPAVGADMVYVASASGAVYGLNRADGSLAWTFRADDVVAGSPSIAGGTVYVGDVVGNVYGIDALTGEGSWRFKADGPVSSTPVLANDMLYVASSNGILYAIQ